MQPEITRDKQPKRNPQGDRKAVWIGILTFLIAAALGRICVSEAVAPFGPAFLAAVAVCGGNTHVALLGALLGTLLLQSPMQLPATAACGLFYTANLVWKRLCRRSARIDRLVLLLIAEAVMLPVFYGGEVAVLLRGMIGLGLSVFSAFAVQSALTAIQSLGRRQVLTDGEQVSISLFFGILLLSAAEVRFSGFSLPVVLLLIFSMVAALARGTGGVAVSVAIGAVLAVSGEFTLMFVGSLAACTLAGAALRKLNAAGVFGGFLAGCLIVGTYVFTASHTINLVNLALAGLVFLCTPKRLMLAVCGYLDASKNRERYAKKSVRRLRERTAAQMQETSKVCREVAALFAERVPEKEPPDAKLQWITQAAASVCTDCPLHKHCWRDGRHAAESVMTMLAAHERGERIKIRQPFDPACRHMQQIAAAAWQAQNQFEVQHAMQQQTARQYAFINRQLTGVCGVLDALGKRVREDRWLDEELEYRLYRALDRHGIRVYGVDAAFPSGKLQLHIRVSETYGGSPLPVLAAIGQTLHRPVRLLDTVQDGRQCTLVLEEAQLMSVAAGIASSAISKSGISGDSTGEKQLEQGRVLFALSDGMGAGQAARTESEAAIRLLFNLYGTGFSRDVALESVNRLLLQHRREMYATLDAVYVDLKTGQTEFIKYGAPPTFVYRGNKLHSICAEALPAGILDEATPAVQTAKLRHDDTVVLFSDGALDALGEYTQKAIAEALGRSGDCERIAQQLLKSAQSRGQHDDMTVMVIRVA